MSFVDKEYGHPPIYVTENGVGTNYPEIDDEQRILYYKSYINEAMKGTVKEKHRTNYEQQHTTVLFNFFLLPGPCGSVQR